jgi:hypothetical protein
MSGESISLVGVSPRIVVHVSRLSVGMSLRGVLVSDGRGCLAVRGERGNEQYEATPVWPKGVTPIEREGEIGVSVPELGVIMEGDEISAAGAFWDRNHPRMKGVKLPARCRQGDGFIVFNGDSFGPAASR